VPAEQTSPIGQALPHAPQFALSEGRWTHTPLQSVDPELGAHANAHVPWTQVLPAGQAMPHPPQFAGLEVVSSHRPPQSVSPAVQLAAHLPAEQTCPFGQALPQVPQLSGSVFGSAQVPLQSESPAWHESAQTPFEQISPAGQAFPHLPQFALSEGRWTHSEPHFVDPPAHAPASPEGLPPPPASTPACPAPWISTADWSPTLQPVKRAIARRRADAIARSAAGRGADRGLGYIVKALFVVGRRSAALT
jgi:hypothetical protein